MRTSVSFEALVRGGRQVRWRQALANQRQLTPGQRRSVLRYKIQKNQTGRVVRKVEPGRLKVLACHISVTNVS